MNWSSKSKKKIRYIVPRPGRLSSSASKMIRYISDPVFNMEQKLSEIDKSDLSPSTKAELKRAYKELKTIGDKYE